MFPGADSRKMMSDYCQTFERLPGQNVQVTRAPGSHLGIVKDFCGNQPLLFDNCNFRERIKLVSPECCFFVYSNQVDLQQVLPLITMLRQRNILVVKEIERNSSVSLINELRDSFYRKDGSLIHHSFANEAISPVTMAEAGFMFCGDELSDTVRCYFDQSVEISNWDSYHQQALSPDNVHRLECSCSDSYNSRFSLPYLLSDSGEDLTGKTYRLMVNNDCPFDCRETMVLSYTGCILRQIGAGEFMVHLDRVRLQDIKQITDYKAIIRLKDREYYDQLQQSLLITHFAEPLRKLEHSSRECIELLDAAKTVLPEDCYCETRDTTTSVLPAVKTEVVKVLEKLVNLKKSELDSVTLDYLGDCFLTAGRQAMAKCGQEDLAELASSYVKRLFLDDFLNDLLSDEQLSGDLPTAGYGTRKKKQVIAQLAEKGSELNLSLRDISQQIKKLLEPFLMDEQSEQTPTLPVG